MVLTNIFQAPSARISVLAKANKPIQQAGYIEADRLRANPILRLKTGGRQQTLAPQTLLVESVEFSEG